LDARNASTSESIPSKIHGIVELISEVFCSTYAMAAHAGTSQSFGASGGAKELKGAEPPGSRCLQPTLPGIACTYGLCRSSDTITSRTVRGGQVHPRRGRMETPARCSSRRTVAASMLNMEATLARESPAR
jgi:hypothetical protein